MSSQSVNLTEWTQVQQHILQFEQEELVTRTFRRLDPERQQAVIAAILDEAVEKGPTALNIKQVAERAGVSIGSLYQYFGSRDGLMNFAIELCVRYMTDLFNSYRPFLTAMPLRDGLTAYLTGGIEWSQTQAGLLQFFARAAYHGDAELADRVVKPIATTLRGIVHAMLVAAQQRGEIRSDLDLEATTRIIHALTIAVGDAELLPYLNNYFQVKDKKVSAQKILDALLALIMQGIGSPQRSE
jgi:TetR/AcrR family transcriptional regulator